MAVLTLMEGIKLLEFRLHSAASQKKKAAFILITISTTRHAG
jgi:hypothetical protein